MRMTKEIFTNLCEDLAYLYIIKCSDDSEKFYKIGVTSKENPYERFSDTPYEVELLRLYSHPSPVFVMDLERKLLSLDYSECLLDINPLIEYLQAIEWITDLKLVYNKDSKRNYARGRKSNDKVLREYRALDEERSMAYLMDDDVLIELAEFNIEEFLQNNPEFNHDNIPIRNQML